MSITWSKLDCEAVQNVDLQAIIQGMVYTDGNGNYAILTITPTDIPDLEP